jgi:hypothetical protein
MRQEVVGLRRDSADGPMRCSTEKGWSKRQREGARRQREADRALWYVSTGLARSYNWWCVLGKREHGAVRTDQLNAVA